VRNVLKGCSRMDQDSINGLKYMAKCRLAMWKGLDGPVVAVFESVTGAGSEGAARFAVRHFRQWRGRHTPGAEARILACVENAKAEALAYLEARTYPRGLSPVRWAAREAKAEALAYLEAEARQIQEPRLSGSGGKTNARTATAHENEQPSDPGVCFFASRYPSVKCCGAESIRAVIFVWTCG